MYVLKIKAKLFYDLLYFKNASLFILINCKKATLKGNLR